VQIVTSSGQPIESTRINFVSQQVDTAIQGILVQKPRCTLPSIASATSNLVKARVVWSTAPAPTVRSLPLRASAGEAFVYVATQTDKGTVAKQRAVTLGDTTGNDYAVLGGLQPGRKSSFPATQFLIDGAPVQPHLAKN